MSKWFTRLAMASTLLISVASVLLTLVVWLGAGSGWMSSGARGSFDFASVLYALMAPMTAVVGALILWSHPHNRVGWIMLALGFCLGLTMFTQAYAVFGANRMPNPLPGYEWAALVSQFAWALVFLPGILLLLLFPTGNFLSPRWRWVAWCAVIVVVGGSVPLFFATPVEVAGVSVANPLGALPTERVLPVASAGFALILVLLTISLVGIVLRYQRAQGSERQQIKWLMYAAAVLITAESFGFILPSNTIGALLINLTALGIPIAIGIAILRYHLYDIDIIIRKTLTYSIVVGLLLFIYFGSVILLQRIVAGMIGNNSEIITVISTLIIAALFVPLRNRIQEAIDRRFYRKKYDAQQVLQKFAVTVRDETDLDKLTGELLNVVNETMQPKNTSVWLKKSEPEVKR
jgi:hypothetical protein